MDEQRFVVGSTTSTRSPASTPSSAWRTTSSTGQSPGSGAAAPACSRERSSRLLDEPIETPGLAEDRLRELASIVGIERELAVGERARRT